MSLFRRREPPKAAVCCASPAMTRRAADWLRALGGCKTIAILSDDCADVVWQCAAEQAALEKAVELKLIDGFCIGDLAAEQMRTWLDETAETINGRSAR